jgi:hypothetical protein
MTRNTNRKLTKSFPKANTKPATARLNVSQKKTVVKESKPGKVNQFARGVGSTIGNIFGGPRLGESLGDASAWLAKIMGFGDYKVCNNTLMTNDNIPSFSSNGDRVIIKHREYIGDILSTINFTNRSYYINPGNETLFPWLSGIAERFKEYRFLGLIFEYKEASSNALNSTNTALGYVVAATDYDCKDPLFSNKREMENTEFVTSTSPATSMIHPIECKPGNNVFNKLYITSANSPLSLPSGTDPRLYFMALTQLATVGMQANDSNIGEWWVSYQVELTYPELHTNVADNLSGYGMTFNSLNGTVTDISSNNQLPSPPLVTFTGTNNSDLRMRLTFPDDFPLYNAPLVLSLTGNSGPSIQPPPVSVAVNTYARANIQFYGSHGGDGTTDNTVFYQVSRIGLAGVDGANSATITFTKFNVTPRGSSSTQPFLEFSVQQFNNAPCSYFLTISPVPIFGLGFGPGLLSQPPSQFNMTGKEEVETSCSSSVSLPTVPVNKANDISSICSDSEDRLSILEARLQALVAALSPH